MKNYGLTEWKYFEVWDSSLNLVGGKEKWGWGLESVLSCGVFFGSTFRVTVFRVECGKELSNGHVTTNKVDVSSSRTAL